MVTAFVLASGSIKALAAEYHVSYPTMRQRLDALIERLRGHVKGKPEDPLGDYLAGQIERGLLSVDTAREIRRLHRSVLTQAIDARSPAEEEQTE